jgi:Ca-activated chloride channel homolog
MSRKPIYSHQTLRHLWIAMIFVLLCSSVFGQHGTQKQLRSGNKAYLRGEYEEAEKQYRNALGSNGSSVAGNYNLAGALYKQNKFDQAYDHYRQALRGEISDSVTRSNIAYNFGNSALQRFLNPREGKDPARNAYLQQSIEAYSEALRYNPENEDARFNLSKALMIRNQQEKQQPQQQNQQEQPEKEEEQPMPETEKREEKRKQEVPEHDPGRMSREDAERILNAIREKEMETAERIFEREKRRASTGRLNDW